MTRIRILAVSDLNGSIVPQSYTDGTPENKGLARLSTLISRLRDENTILLDNGNDVPGSALSYYHHCTSPDTVSPVTKVMREMGFDYVNIGDHDFDYGENALMVHLSNIEAPCITSNWIYRGKSYGPTYVIHEIKGFRIAIFALTTPAVSRYAKKRGLRHSRFLDAFASAKRTVENIRKLEKPDFIVCLYHGGFERDLQFDYPTEADTGENQAYRICRLIPGIDVLITGHQGRSLSGTLNGVTYTQTERDGAEVACIDIFPESRTIDARVLKADVPADDVMLEMIREDEDACREWLDQEIASAETDLNVTGGADSLTDKPAFITFLNQVCMEKTGAQLSALSLDPQTQGLPASVTMRDLLRNCGTPSALTVKKLSGRDLKTYLEKCAEFWTVRSGKPAPASGQIRNYDMMDGVSYTIHASWDPGMRITDLTYDGTPVTDDMEFTLCMSTARASGENGFEFLRSLPTVREIRTPMAYILAEYLKDRPSISIENVQNIAII